MLDVGNTNTVLGIYDKGDLFHYWRISTDRNKTEDEMAMLLKALFTDKDLSFQDIEGIIISSVVPPINFALEKMCQKYFRKKPLIVGPDIDTGLDIQYQNPHELGADRIVNAVGAIEEYGKKRPLIIIDFGTATTFCYINEKMQYMGGAIAPGIGISTEALYSKASKLPRIEIAPPDYIIGNTTVSAMQSGVFYGYVGLVEGIVTRMKKEAEMDPYVIATGGLAPLIANETNVIDKVDLFITLKGLYVIYERNKTKEFKLEGEL